MNAAYNHASARLDSRADAGLWLVALSTDGETDDTREDALATLRAVFPHVDPRALASGLQDDGFPGLWLARLPLAVATLVASGSEFAWTEPVVADEHESLHSVLVEPAF